MQHEGETEYLDCRSLAEKHATYETLYWRMRRMPERDRVAFMSELARQYGFDLARQCRELIMTLGEPKARRRFAA